MSDSVKNFMDRVLYSFLIAAAILFIIGMAASIGVMARMGLWILLLGGIGVSAMRIYEYLWRNKDASKEKTMLIMMVASVAITLLILSMTIFFLNGKILTLPA